MIENQKRNEMSQEPGCRGAEDRELGEMIAKVVFKPPEPFANVNTPEPPFPVESFPGELGEFVRATAASLEVPAAMVGTGVLGVLAVSLQRKVCLRIKPGEQGWREHLCLYTYMIAKPSERKSATISAVTRPIYKYEEAVNEKLKPEISDYKKKKDFMERKIKRLEGKACNDEIDYTEVQKVQREMESLKVVRKLRLHTSDVTPERLAELLAEQGERMAIISAEGGNIGNMLGRYSSNPNNEIYQKAFCGDPSNVDRVGKESIDLKEPTLSMVMAIQPYLAVRMETDEELKSCGFTDRALYTMPDSLVGTRDARNAPDMPDYLIAWYDSLIQSFLSWDTGGEILEAEMDEKAKIFFYDCWKEYEVGQRRELEWVEGFAGKLSGVQGRIATLLHFAKHGREAMDLPISRATVAAAKDLSDYYLAENQRVQHMAFGDEGIKRIEYVMRRIRESGEAYLKRSEIQTLCRGAIKRSNQLDAPLEALTKNNWLVAVKPPYKGKGRPPEMVYVVNPALSQGGARLVPKKISPPAPQTDSDFFNSPGEMITW